jgi:long-chain acyl-CoA synthetase
VNPSHHPINPTPDTLLGKFFERTSGAGNDRVYLRYKPTHGEPYRDITFAEFGERVREVFAGLARLGIRRGDRIAVVSESRPEWLISEFAALALGAIWVPMFPTLTAQQIEFIVNDSEAKMLIVSNDLQFGKALKLIGNCPSLKTLMIFNSETKLSTPTSIRFLHFKDISTITGSILDFDAEARKATSTDTVTIIYTSGTTGNPKGVMLSHGNIMANIEGALAAIPKLTDADIALSFLPLCHAFEHVAMHFFFYRGMTVAFAESVDTVADNLLEIRPTIMTGVPRFYERVHGRIMRMREKLPPAKHRMFDWALGIGAKNGLAFEGNAVPIIARMLKPVADALVLKKIRERTGGRIRFFVSGAAALPAEVGRAFAAFGLPIIEGYGLTETSPVLSVNPYQKLKWGTVGKPLHNVEIKIANDGEILARGANVMQGYYKQPEATRDMIDMDGWLHTGDIGALDSDGYLKITDRKKHIFVSSGGKNIAPAPIESLLGESRFIHQIMLLGDKRPFCTALIVPDFDALNEVNINHDVQIGDDRSSEVLVTNEAIRDLIGVELDRLQSGIASFERVRRFMLLPDQFTIENGMMTPTLKIRRKAVEERYRELIDSMYQVRPVSLA